ncbi:hypothetical protein OIU84_024681 [Salix udensis]|uniref:Uncharacterized protein n=1 Tax=Salix udensis TaxID=889485 RepID=A0AAD6KJ89_9ROSI|nr:hypothetical protein OIU84_024681 [Salix udensis]
MSSKTISKGYKERAIHIFKIQILTFCHLPAVRQASMQETNLKLMDPLTTFPCSADTDTKNGLLVGSRCCGFHLEFVWIHTDSCRQFKTP